MALALKNHTPISARSPYFINCVAFSGTIVSATLSVTIQLGDRRSSITSMTDVKTYSLTKTDAIDGIIVFDISAIVGDFFTHEYREFTTSDYKVANEGQVYFVKVTKAIVNSGGSESPTTEYFTIKDAYSYFKDGVNYLPSTGASGNYPFEGGYTGTAAYGTDVTIMATDCYRQIGENSYAVLGLDLGEFERNNSSAASFAKVKFGAGESWKTSLLENTNAIYNNIDAVDVSPARYDTIEDSIVYIPLGAKNMFANWSSGFDYLRVGHFVSASQILPTILDTESFESSTPLDWDAINSYLIVTVTDTPKDQATVSFEMPAFTDCSVGWLARTDTWTVVSIVDNTFTLSIADATARAQAECLADTIVGTSSGFYGVIQYERLQVSTEMLSVNAQPVLRYEIICEPKYDVIDCLFINKWGCWDSFSFLKKSMTKFNTTSSSYNRNIGFVDRGPLGIDTPTYSYSLTDHSKVEYNKNGIESITCNTGFVDESFNLLLQELMLSEKVYLIIDDVVEPVVLNNKSVDFKKHVNDKLIDYTLEFEFAYQKLNSIY